MDLSQPLLASMDDHGLESGTEGPDPCSLSCHKLSFEAGRKIILHKISAEFLPGENVAIMGPSGSGKTTLLNILFGVQGGSTGEVMLNGKPLDMRVMRKHAVFITQDDLLHGALSPYDAMCYAADLRLPASSSPVQKQSLIHKILKDFGLLECARVKTGHPEGEKGLSGGQRKRLSVALEMVSNPSLIFLDEPTSGLDTHTARDLVARLRNLARAGHTVVCTIHQPSSSIFRMFDKVMMLSEGEVVYHDKVVNVVPFFNSIGYPCPELANPADFITELVTDSPRPAVAQIVGRFKEWRALNPDPAPMLAPATYPTSRYPVATSVQFRSLLHRGIKCIVKDRKLSIARGMVHAVFGVLMGLLYWQLEDDQKSTSDRAGFCFFSLIFVALIAIMPTVLAFPAERAVFEKEHRNNWYGVAVYYMSRSFSDLPFMIVFPWIYASVSFWMIGLGDSITRYLLFGLAAMMQTLVAHSLGLLVGSLAPSVQTAVLMAPMLAIPPFLLCGFFANLDIMPHFFYCVSFASWARYSFGAIAIAAFHDKTMHCSEKEYIYPVPSNPKFRVCPMTNGDSYLHRLDLKFYQDDWMSAYWIYIAIMFVFIVWFRILAYQILKRKAKNLGPPGCCKKLPCGVLCK